MKKLITCTLVLFLGVGCAHDRAALPSTQSPLALSRVVLYRNGVGYFERQGVVSGDKLTLKVRKDQVNDLLKSLTVIDRNTGKAVSVSIPLDPKVWQDAALAMLTPGNGRLADVLDALRGTHVSVQARNRELSGRIVMVEKLDAEPMPEQRILPPPPLASDHKLTLLDGNTLQVVKLSEVQDITLLDGDLAMQLDRHLDATAGEGMFQQVDVVVRLSDDGKHDLAVSYVAPAPLWKPTYRLVLAEDGSGTALLQAWAVVSNVSGENWNDVALGLTSGAPLAFRYDLHTPQEVERPDLTQSGVQKHAEVAMGESTYSNEPPPPMAAREEGADGQRFGDGDEMVAMGMATMGAGVSADAMAERSVRASKAKRSRAPSAPTAAPMPAAVDMAELAQSIAPQVTAKRVAGLTRFDIESKVTLPDGSASMVALVNQKVPGEEIFLYKPGGSGQGYESNPYRVVRFKNDTDFVLEPGPISIYSGGSFVGEGLSEAIASRDMATIPFAVESSLLVRSSVQGNDASGGEMKLIRIVRGVMEVESFHELKTKWVVEGKAIDKQRRVLVRQSRAYGEYALVNPPKDTETLADGYFIPVILPARQGYAELTVVERSPSRFSLTIWDEPTPKLLEQLLSTPALDERTRAALKPILEARQTIGRIDTEIAGLQAQQQELDERSNETRQNLLAIQKDPKAGALRKRLSERLEETTQKAAELGRKLVELNSQRLEKRIALEDGLRDLDLSPPKK